MLLTWLCRRRSDILNEHIPLARPSSPWQPATPDVQGRSANISGPYTNPSRPAPTAYPTSFAGVAESSSRDPQWEYASSSLLPRRRSTTGDTATMIRRTLEGGEDEEQEILELARRLSRPLVGKDVRRAYGGNGSNKDARGIKRMETT